MIQGGLWTTTTKGYLVLVFKMFSRGLLCNDVLVLDGYYQQIPSMDHQCLINKLSSCFKTLLSSSLKQTERDGALLVSNFQFEILNLAEH